MPRFAFRMIRLLVGMCSVKTETLVKVLEFSFFTGTSKVSEIFTQYFYATFYFVLIFHNFWSYRSIQNLQIATDCSVFDRFYFSCVVRLF